MAHTSSSRKRIRQNNHRRSANSAGRSRLRTLVKKLRHACGASEKDLAAKLWKSVQKALDSSASKGLIHKRKASRQKSLLNKHVAALTADSDK